MPAEPTKPDTRKIEARVLDRPDLMETFADAIGPISFDGNTLRIEFLVARMGAAAPGQAPAVHAVPACRLVLTAKAATDLVNRLRSLSEQIQKQAAQSRQGRETK